MKALLPEKCYLKDSLFMAIFFAVVFTGIVLSVEIPQEAMLRLTLLYIALLCASIFWLGCKSQGPLGGLVVLAGLAVLLALAGKPFEVDGVAVRAALSIIMLSLVIAYTIKGLSTAITHKEKK